MKAILVAAALALPMAAYAGLSVSGTPKVAFFATGSPGFLDIEGDSTTLTVTDDGTNLVFTVPMKTVSTGISMRDDHMNNEFVQVDKYPNVTLTLAKSAVQWPANAGDKTTGTASGTFNAHGVDQPASVTYTVKKTSTGYTVTGSFKFDASKHGIAIPSYMGVTVDPAMHAEVTVSLAGA